jgi:hypothetical protein
VAEGVGFEPTKALPLCSISSRDGIHQGSGLKESADLPNRMIDLNWGRQYRHRAKASRSKACYAHPPLSASILSIAAYFRFREACRRRKKELENSRGKVCEGVPLHQGVPCPSADLSKWLVIPCNISSLTFLYLIR